MQQTLLCQEYGRNFSISVLISFKKDLNIEAGWGLARLLIGWRSQSTSFCHSLYEVFGIYLSKNYFALFSEHGNFFLGSNAYFG